MLGAPAQRLVVLETTNGLLDERLYGRIAPSSSSRGGARVVLKTLRARRRRVDALHARRQFWDI